MFFVLIPARCFVFDVLSLPCILSVFSTTVVTVLFCFRNFLAFRILISFSVFLGNFRMAMLPIMSCGIFFIVNHVSKCIKGLLIVVGYGNEGK